MTNFTPELIERNEHVAWDKVWSGQLYEESIAIITSLSGQTKLIVDLCEVTSQSRVLDVGCGPGLLSESLAEYASSVEGIDFSKTMIEYARESRAGATFRVANAESLPFEESEFDVAVCCYTSHHFARPEKVYREILRVLKPGGRVAFIHPIQSENAAFGAIFEVLGDVLPSAKMEAFPTLGGPLFEVETPDPYVRLLTECGFVGIACDKRVKNCRVTDEKALLNVILQVGKLENSSEELQNALLEAIDTNLERYRQSDRSYVFPDKIIVGNGTKPDGG